MYPEDGSSSNILNISTILPDRTALHPRSQHKLLLSVMLIITVASSKHNVSYPDLFQSAGATGPLIRQAHHRGPK